MAQFRELTDRYRLEKILRPGRAGTILRATDTQTGEAVAIKLITVAASDRFAQEAQRFSQLASVLTAADHPSFPRIVDSGLTTDGSAFLALELLAGAGFETLAGETPARLFPLLYQALDGLQLLAEFGLAHHNFAPENLFVVSTAAGGEQAKLLGLGSAYFHRPAAAGPEPESARFRAPELVASPETADSRADVYSFALTACQMLGATVAFGDAAGPIVQMPLALSFELENDEALRKILERCLKQEPRDRPSPQEIRSALGLALGATRPAMVIPDLEPDTESSPLPGLAALDLTSLDLPPLGESAKGEKPAEVFRAEPEWAAPVESAPPITALSSFDLPPLGPVSSPPLPFVPPPAPPQLVAESVPASAAAGGGAPPETADMLSSLDVDLLAPLPPPMPVASAPAGRGSGTAGKSKEVPLGPGAPRSAARPLWRNPFVMAGAAGGVVLLGLLAVWFLRREPEKAPMPQPRPVALAPKVVQPPEKPPAEKLAEAKASLAQGDLFKARQALRSLSAADRTSLGPAGGADLRATEQALSTLGRQRFPDDLANGLKTGDLGLLQNAVAAGTEQEATLPPTLKPDFDRARGLVQIYSQAEAAAAKGDNGQVLERLSALEPGLKEVRDPAGLRDHAAAAIEAQAEALGREGKYAEAIAILEPIRRFWANRAGLKERSKSYETFQHNEAEQAALLASIPAYERRRKPDEALALMKDLKPTPHLEAQLGEAHKRLETQLAQLDGKPPVITLRDGYYLEYSRGTVANLSFRVTDDYQVKSVKMMARPEGGKMREYPLEAARGGYYTARIAPNYHQNGTVDFYVEATDLSNHVGTFGSASQPKQLKRSQGFNRLLQ